MCTIFYTYIFLFYLYINTKFCTISAKPHLKLLYMNSLLTSGTRGGSKVTMFVHKSKRRRNVLISVAMFQKRHPFLLFMHSLLHCLCYLLCKEYITTGCAVRRQFHINHVRNECKQHHILWHVGFVWGFLSFCTPFTLWFSLWWTQKCFKMHV